MANRNSNDYKIMIIPEVSDGTQIFAGTTGKCFADKFEWMREPITSDRAIKNGKLFDDPLRTVVTGEKVTATMSGELTTSHDILLQGLFDDASSPYTFAAHMPTAKTYNIYQLYLDATGACTTYDVILGAFIREIQMSGKANSIWTYSVNIEAKSYRENVTNSLTNALTSIPTVTGNPFLFGSTTGTFNFGDTTHVNSIDLTISKTMDSDENRWQNGLTRNNNRYIGVGGTLSYSYLWDGAKMESQGQSTKYETSALSEAISLTALVGAATHIWIIETTGRITDITRPDADRGTFIGTVTENLIDSGSDVPVTITVMVS